MNAFLSRIITAVLLALGFTYFDVHFPRGFVLLAFGCLIGAFTFYGLSMKILKRLHIIAEEYIKDNNPEARKILQGVQLEGRRVGLAIIMVLLLFIFLCFAPMSSKILLFFHWYAYFSVVQSLTYQASFCCCLLHNLNILTDWILK